MLQSIQVHFQATYNFNVQSRGIRFIFVSSYYTQLFFYGFRQVAAIFVVATLRLL